MSKWLDNRLSEADHDLAFALAKGAYQRSVLLGQEALSGSTLRGRASRRRASRCRSGGPTTGGGCWCWALPTSPGRGGLT